jgi:hypothetical protein
MPPFFRSRALQEIKKGHSPETPPGGLSAFLQSLGRHPLFQDQIHDSRAVKCSPLALLKHLSGFHEDGLALIGNQHVILLHGSHQVFLAHWAVYARAGTLEALNGPLSSDPLSLLGN